KQIYIIKNSINILVEIKNTDFDIINSLYGCEFNFSFLGGHSHDRYYLIDGSKPEIPELDSSGIDTCAEISLVTEWENMRCNLKFEKDTKVWRYPVETINMSESGFEKVYQCSSILPTWDINLRPGEKFKTQITVQVHAAAETN
ncbi:MAG: alpha-amylase/4-alpha-glucanotransferase domain-containing protein, partial [Fidelibacterota bacterium]